MHTLALEAEPAVEGKKVSAWSLQQWAVAEVVGWRVDEAAVFSPSLLAI
jgi:hypothetical protein